MRSHEGVLTLSGEVYFLGKEKKISPRINVVYMKNYDSHVPKTFNTIDTVLPEMSCAFSGLRVLGPGVCE